MVSGYVYYLRRCYSTIFIIAVTPGTAQVTYTARVARTVKSSPVNMGMHIESNRGMKKRSKLTGGLGA